MKLRERDKKKQVNEKNRNRFGGVFWCPAIFFFFLVLYYTPRMKWNEAGVPRTLYNYEGLAFFTLHCQRKFIGLGPDSSPEWSNVTHHERYRSGRGLTATGRPIGNGSCQHTTPAGDRDKSAFSHFVVKLFIVTTLRSWGETSYVAVNKLFFFFISN